LGKIMKNMIILKLKTKFLMT